MKRLERFKGCTSEARSLDTGEPMPIGLCNKILKVSEICVFQDESSTQGKLPQYILGINSSKTKLTPAVPRFGLKKCRTDLRRSLVTALCQ